MSRGNIAREMNEMVGARAATTTDVHIQYSIGNKNLIVRGHTAITAESALSALCEDVNRKVRYATNCIIQSVSSLATLTCVWVNSGTVGSAPTFTAVNSITY